MFHRTNNGFKSLASTNISKVENVKFAIIRTSINRTFRTVRFDPVGDCGDIFYAVFLHLACQTMSYRYEHVASVHEKANKPRNNRLKPAELDDLRFAK